MPTDFKHRLALVIGAQKYKEAELNRLHNSASDAETLAEVLRSKAGFELFRGGELVNPTGRQLTTHINAFCNAVNALEDCLALIYFSGHGTVDIVSHSQHREALHYLLATDYSERELGDRDTALQHAACQLESQVVARLCGAKAAVVLVDACRTAPDLSAEPEAHKGWGGDGSVRASHAVNPVRNVLLSYACAAYSPASDGTAADGLGVFTRHILEVRSRCTVGARSVCFLDLLSNAGLESRCL